VTLPAASGFTVAVKTKGIEADAVALFEVIAMAV